MTIDDVGVLTLLLILLIPLLAFVLLAVGSSLFLGRAVPVDDGEWERVERPWWGNPLLWLGVAAIFVFLGLVVAPQLLGGVFLFIPFFWVGGRRWRPRVRTCASCGAALQPGFDTCPRCGAAVRR